MMEGPDLLQALLTGRLEALPEETLFLLARCGLVHLFTAAGFHLAIAARFADALSYPVRRWLPEGRPRATIALATRLGLLAWLAELSGWGAPMVRAFLYLCLREASALLELEADRGWLLVLSLLASALAGASAFSLALSGCALAGAVFTERRRPLERALGPWLFTLPVCAWRFGLVAALGPFWSLAAGPLVGAISLPLGIAARLAEGLGFPSGPVRGAAEGSLRLLVKLVGAGDGILGGGIWVRPAPWTLLTIALLAGWRLRRRRPRAAIATTVGGLCAAALIPRPSLSALDVGQGDAIYLRTGSTELLEDVGPPGFRGRSAPVCGRLEALGVADVDDVLLSHFDLDHRGGLDSLLARHRVRGALWFREVDLSAKRHEKVLLAAERADVPIRFLTDDHAPAGLRCWLAPYTDGNDSSPLCRAELRGGSAVLLTGDMSEQAEAWFVMAVHPFPRAPVLKVAHHGSRGSSSEAFLAASGARTALISVGARNRYGHPSPEALTRLHDAGMGVRRTDREGDLAVYPYLGESWPGFTEDSIRPPAATVNSRVYPGNPATASWL